MGGAGPIVAVDCAEQVGESDLSAAPSLSASAGGANGSAFTRPLIYSLNCWRGEGGMDRSLAPRLESEVGAGI